MAVPGPKKDHGAIRRFYCMKCATVIASFDRLYREGDGFDRPDIVAHLETCDRCSQAYSRWCAVARSLGGVPEPELSPALYGRVMMAIDDLRGRKAQGSLAPGWQPFGWAVAAAAVVAISVLFLVPRNPPVAPAAGIVPVPAAAQPVVTAHFELSRVDAHTVALVGDFNGWDTGENQMIQSADGTWSIDLPLPKGNYQYLFLVDGNRWQADTRGVPMVPDGFGGVNSVIEL